MRALRLGGFLGLWRGGRLRARLLDLQFVAHEDGLVGLHNGFVGLVVVGHFNKSVTFRTTRLMVHDDFARLHGAELFEQGPQVFGSGLKG